ncbi:MAG: hypothetical protein LBD58_08560 [Treponema sp.]|jgi:hypothetical protein|nr:hypothetical protein [Treponema sp.]
MKQGIQSEIKHKMINKYGCYFLRLVELGGRLSGANCESGMEEMYSKHTQNGAMKKDCSILYPAFILGDLTGKRYYFPRPKEKPDCPYYIIENVKPGHTHFTLFYEGGIWDPLPPERPAARRYKPNSYRFFEEMR